jgi:GT2 family glycosyltransferase
MDWRYNHYIMISVVIATLNRADVLEKISLPSLVRQNFTDFEVVVWDASDSNDSKIVCERFMPEFEKKGASLEYFKAPRRGSSSQRNDAAASAVGDIIFFIDDDCEISIDSLYSLSICFNSFPWLNGSGLPMLNKTQASGNSSILKFATKLFGMKNNQLQRKINRSGGLSLPIKDLPGPAEWLSGGAMAFRKSVFEKVSFDERLEIFGGYAIGEDYDFSHRVMLEFGQPHMIANGGFVVHHAAGGARMAGREKIASYFFNGELIRRNFKRYGKHFSKLWIAWGNLATILLLLKSGSKPGDIIAGRRMAKEGLRTWLKLP